MVKKLLVIVFILCTLVINTMAQNIIGVVDYMKADDPDAYVVMEEQWEQIHKERLKAGMIIGWAVYKVMFKTVEDPYNFITISWYDGFSKLDKEIPQEILDAAYPGHDKKYWDNFMEKTENSRKMISSGVFHQRLSCINSLDHKGQYYVLNEISVKPGKSKEYLRITEDIYKPVFEEDIKIGGRTTWGLWEKWPGNMKDFQYVTADGYEELDQIEHSNFNEIFKRIHPGENIEDISQQMEDSRILVNTEMWKMLYRVLK